MVSGSEIYAPLHPSTLADPYPVFRRLQLEAPVVWHDQIFAWVLTRYSDCHRVLTSPDAFSRNPRDSLGLNSGNLDEMTIQSHDPPHPTLVRQALAIALDLVDVTHVCFEAIGELESRLKSHQDWSDFDFMSEVAAPTALRFACGLMGVSSIPVDVYGSIFLRITRAMDSSLDEGRSGPGGDATRELIDLIAEAQCRPEPGGVIGALRRAQAETHPTQAYVRNTLAAMFNAAYSTAYTSMGTFLDLALDRPGMAQGIVESGHINEGVQELLRFTSPAQATMRFASADTIIGGMQISRADPVVTLLAAANRDPEEFEHPDDLVIDRSPNRHLGFGWGPHFCVGAAPAKTFLGHYIHRLAQWETKITRIGRVNWLDTATLRCLDFLPVAFRD